LSEWLSKGLLRRMSTPGKCVYLKQIKMFYSYILKSLKEGKYYYGSCGDLVKRLQVHNSGKVKSTKGRRPFEMIYSEKFELEVRHFKENIFIKQLKGTNI